MTIIDTIQRYRDQLDALLTGQAERTDHPRPLADRPLQEQLEVFEQIAQGKIDRNQADPAFVAEVEDAVDRLLVLLCVPPDLENQTIETLPPNLWERSPLGLLLADVIWWLHQHDMITMSEAAQLLYGAASLNEFQKIRTLVNKGELFPFIDPHESNPQYARRFRQSHIIAWKEQQAQGKPKAPPLPKDQVDIVKLHDVEGKSFQEIGNILGVKRQAVHQMYHQLKNTQSKK